MLHDLFGMPFEEIAPSSGNPWWRRASWPAERGGGCRGRRRRASATTPGMWPATARWCARSWPRARGGDLEGLVAVLDSDVVLHSDGGTAAPERTRVVRGAHSVATGALIASRLVGTAKLVLVNGAPGVVSFDATGRPYAVMGFAFRAGKITQIDILGDPDRLARLDLAAIP